MVTPPLDGLILPGITRDSILRLARQWNSFSVKEEKFTMPEILKLVKEERVSIVISTKCLSFQNYIYKKLTMTPSCHTKLYIFNL